MGPLAFPGCEVGESVGDSMMGSCALETRDVDDMAAYLCLVRINGHFIVDLAIHRRRHHLLVIHLYPSLTLRTPRDVYATLSFPYLMAPETSRT